MKAKWEGAFSVVLAVTLIFSIEYYYYAACSRYDQEEQIAGETVNVAAIPVSHSSINVPVRLRQETRDNLFPKQVSPNRKEQCGCLR